MIIELNTTDKKIVVINDIEQPLIYVPGMQGPPGADGKSAYESAVEGGFVGTEAEWLASLQGADGAPGPQGPQGEVGPQGPKGDDGYIGADGLSAYEVAVANGFVGTEAQWLASLVGPQGPQGEQGADGATGPQGPQGETGPQGPQGIQGETGPQGIKGDTGATGPQGPQGIQGPEGPTVFATAATGTEIDFAAPKVFNSPASPATGNITNNLTGAKFGIVQKIYHNHTAAPTFPAGWVRLGTATYTTSALNIIYAEWVSGTRVEYWFSR